MQLLSLRGWNKQSYVGPALISLDDDTSANFELRVILNIDSTPGERWLTCLVRGMYPSSVGRVHEGETEHDLISGGGGVGVEFSRSSGVLSQLFVPVMHGFIDAILDDVFPFKTGEMAGMLPVLDGTPWFGAHEVPSATRAFRAPVQTVLLKSQRGLLVRWADGSEQPIAWRSFDGKVVLGTNQRDELIGFAVVDLPPTIFDKIVQIDRMY